MFEEKHIYNDSDGNQITYAYIKSDVFKFLNPKKVDFGLYFKEIFFEYNSDNKYFKMFNDLIREDIYISIEINQEKLMILKLKKFDFDLFIENGKFNIDECRKIVAQLYGYFVGYIEGFILGYEKVI